MKHVNHKLTTAPRPADALFRTLSFRESKLPPPHLIFAAIGSVVYDTGRTRTLNRVTGIKESLAFSAPAPIRLTYKMSAVVPNYCVMATVGCVMSLTVRGANSLACVAAEKQSLAFVTPSPIPLLSGAGTRSVVGPRLSFAEVNQIFPALRGVMRLTVRRADSLVRIAREKQSLALEAPFPARLIVPYH